MLLSLVLLLFAALVYSPCIGSATHHHFATLKNPMSRPSTPKPRTASSARNSQSRQPRTHAHGSTSIRNDSPRALWQQLQQVAALVQAVQAGSSATAVLEQMDAAHRPGVQALGYAVLRNLGVAQWLLGQLVQRKPPAPVQALLCSALALAWQSPVHKPAEPEACTNTGSGNGKQLAQPAAATPSTTTPTAHASSATSATSALPEYTDFTLVSQAVEAAKRHPQMQHQASLVNACLRRFLRERALWLQRCQQASPQGQTALLNLPNWWLKQLQHDHPNNATEIALAGQQQAPMTLRVNARHMPAHTYLHTHLQAAGLSGALTGSAGIVLHQPCPVQHLPGFAQGWVSVQDAGAQLAAPLLLDALSARTSQHAAQQAPLRLLDACAAPGGKTAHLLELANHAVTALDVDAQRCQRIAETLQRLGLQASLRTADAAAPQDWWDGKPFDGILLDAPCTASGIVRRHPDIVWLRRPQDIAGLAAQQHRLLEALWPLLAVGGVMLYCTCSVFKAEGETQIQAFCARHRNAKRLPAPGHLLPALRFTHKITPENHALNADNSASSANTAQSPSITHTFEHDGFFYALLAKTD